MSKTAAPTWRPRGARCSACASAPPPFRGIDAVVNAVGPALRKHKVIVTPEVRTYEYGTVEVGRNRTQMGHVRVLVAYAAQAKARRPQAPAPAAKAAVIKAALRTWDATPEGARALVRLLRSVRELRRGKAPA